MIDTISLDEWRELSMFASLRAVTGQTQVFAALLIAFVSGTIGVALEIYRRRSRPWFVLERVSRTGWDENEQVSLDVEIVNALNGSVMLEHLRYQGGLGRIVRIYTEIQTKFHGRSQKLLERIEASILELNNSTDDIQIEDAINAPLLLRHFDSVVERGLLSGAFSFLPPAVTSVDKMAVALTPNGSSYVIGFTHSRQLPFMEHLLDSPIVLSRLSPLIASIRTLDRTSLVSNLNLVAALLRREIAITEVIERDLED